MSRHRIVRNLDLDEELADDFGYDDDPYEDLEPGDRESLDTAYATILDVLGPPESANNPFAEREIKDALWDAYFDTEAVLDDLMKEAEKRNKKKQGLLDEDGDREDDMDVDGDMSRLSLVSSSSRGSQLRGRARGIAGLTSRGGRGGRAGMAKRNLASLAPGGLPGVPVTSQRAFGPQPGDVGTRSTRNSGAQSPQQASADSAPSEKPMSKLALLAQKRKAAAATAATASEASLAPPASQPASEAATRQSPSKRPSESQPASSTTLSSASPSPGGGDEAAPTSRPSKLMALAQGRKAKGAEASRPARASEVGRGPEQSSGGPSASETKPMSKLQQRALAAKKEREERERRDVASVTSSASMDVDGGASTGADAAVQQILPGGLPENSLFPDRTAEGTRRSDVGLVLGGGSVSSDGANRRRYVSANWLQIGGEAGEAFTGPSPDDKVLSARQGTQLRN